MRSKQSILLYILLYIIASLLWFYISDSFLFSGEQRTAATTHVFIRIEDLLFILFTSICLYYFFYREQMRDAAQRKLIETTQESNRIHLDRFHAVTSATNDILWDWDIVNNTIWRNENYEKLTGYAPDEHVPSETYNWIDYLHKDDRECIRQLLQNALSGLQTNLECEYRMITKDHRIINIRDRSYIYRDASGKAVRMVGSMQDITSLRASQRLLQQSEEHYRQIVETAHEGIWQIDENGITTFVNTSVASLLGYGKDEMVGKIMLDFVFEEDVKAAKEHMRLHMQGIRQQFEFKLKKKDGGIVWVLVKGTPVFEKTVYKGSIGMISDISGLKEANRLLKESEQNYLLLFKMNPMPMWVYNAENFAFLDVNEAALQHYGYTRDEFLSLKVTEIRQPAEIEKFKKEHKEVSEGIRYAGIWKHVKKNGEEIDVEIIMRFLLYNGLKSHLVLVKDITDKLKAEKELLKSYDEIRKLAVHLQHVRDDERKRIAREIHDELGQKLTAIKMDVAWMDKQLDKDVVPVKTKIKETLAFVDESNLSVKKILNELRTDFLTRFGTGEALKWLTGQFEKQTGISVQLMIDDAIDELEDELATCLYRVLQESLTNITKYANTSIVTVELLQHEHTIVLQIKDYGVGFDESKIKADQSFGLLGMKERVANMNGTFTITTAPGRGTLIKVEIPMNKIVTV